MWPSMRMRSPSEPSRARMFCASGALVLRPAMAGMVPICRNGPAVCEGVSFSAISCAPVLEIGRLLSAQHDVEAVGQAIEGLHALHVELRDQAGDRLRIPDGVDDDAARDQRIAF